MAARPSLRECLQATDTVEKLLLRSYAKDYRPAEASFLLGLWGTMRRAVARNQKPSNNAPTIRGVDCRLQGTIARIRGECNLGFFNRIGQLETFNSNAKIS